MADENELTPSELGDISVSNEVFETIAATCTQKIAGVMGIENSDGLFDSLSKVRGRSDAPKGVKVTTGESEVTVDMTVTVIEGYAIPQVTDRIQREVKSVIEEMTGHSVKAVNIIIADVRPLEVETDVIPPDEGDQS